MDDSVGPSALAVPKYHQCMLPKSSMTAFPVSCAAGLMTSSVLVRFSRADIGLNLQPISQTGLILLGLQQWPFQLIRSA